ncbi:hypothetical protein ABPG75_006946 [Micractinium tetrahymenae]
MFPLPVGKQRGDGGVEEAHMDVYALTQLDTHVSALEGLLQEPAARLCPATAAAAADSALALLSGLQAARLQLGDGSPAAGGLAAQLHAATQRLLGALQQGLAPPTPAPPGAAERHCASAYVGISSGAAPSLGSKRRQELAQLVQGLGCSTQEWQAAQATLAQRTAAALQRQPRRGPPGQASSQSTAHACSPLDRLLAAAVHTPAWQARSGQPSALHAAVQRLLGLLRQLPPAEGPAAVPAAGSSLSAGLQARQQQAQRSNAQQAQRGHAQHAQQAQRTQQAQQAQQLAELELSEEGWAAYWMLEPLALQQALAEILQAAAAHSPGLLSAQPPRQGAIGARARPHGHQQGAQQHPEQHPEQHQVPQDLWAVLRQRPRWAATSAAAAAQPALHLAIRQTLHRWLAASGSPSVWRLLLLYLQAACGSSSGGQPGPVGQAPGQLPTHLAVLHPPSLAHAAALLLTEQPSEAGLERAVAALQAFLQHPPASEQWQQRGSQGGQATDLLAMADRQCSLADQLSAEQQLLAGQQVEKLQRQEAVWRLQLDAPGWALFCLRRLPLQRLLQLAAAEDGLPAAELAEGGQPGWQGVASEAASPQAGSVPTSAAAAAAYVALLLWPGEHCSRQVLQEALCLQLQDVSLPALRPWLEMLHRWQHMLSGWCPTGE